MENFGGLLYEGKTDNNKNGIGFVISAILLFIGAQFIYAKIVLMIMSGIILLIGLYLLIFKRSEKFSIYERVITITEKGKEYVIPKEEIARIEYQEVKVRRSPVTSYYPILVLNDQNQILLNKVFNSVINKDFAKIIQSYK